MMSAPSWPMAAALAGAVAMPAVLLGWSVLARRPPPPGARLRLSVLAGVAVWIAGAAAAAAAGRPPTVPDLLAGAAMQGAAAVLCFIPWSLIVWGFTLNMLLALAQAGRPLDLDGWARAYAGDGGLDRIRDDRAALLLAAGFAVRTADSYAITPAGRTAAAVLRVLRALFGIR
jgi:hypothetical protein